MQFTVLHLNIERDKHVERVSRLIADVRPDVICLEEALLEDVKTWSQEFDYEFIHAPLVETELGAWGSAILSSLPIESAHTYTYGSTTGAAPTRSLADVISSKEGRPTDRFEYRYAVPTLRIRIDDILVTIATTHFPVTDHDTPGLGDHELRSVEEVGAISRSREYFDNLLAVVRKLPHPLIFTTDLNNPRGEYIYDTLAHELIDLVPSDLDSTIDPKYHRNPRLRYVVDTILISTDVQPDDVRIIDDVSDHKAIIAALTAS